jgi:hypothetical protein
MKNLKNKRVVKLTVGDLKEKIKGLPDDTDVVLGFYMKEDGVHYCYLGDVFNNLKFDSVQQEKLIESFVVELVGYSDKYCTYVEKLDDIK